ncbi:hypothetical protein OEZ85_005028 [Tetradesmus obliquus]|uniref:Uncharacterized protein n=1 Tax=Tetradesmus obliquus TaxID=3088 RepID=A0ABY8UH29_TETOB|nr:hypothetical protein OEZ85_005028 [Tetradesmus obliquus]
MQKQVLVLQAELSSREQLLVEQAQGVASWCNTAVSRISRGRAASAAQCAAARDASNCWGGSNSSSGARGMPGSRGSWDDGAEAEAGVMSSLQQLQLQYVPAGGNNAEQTKLVSGPVQRAAAAAADAAEEFEAEGELQQRREDAVQLARQLLRGLLLLDQQGGAGSGSALRALAGLLRQQRDVVEDLPQLLQESSAAAVKAAVLAAVAGAFEDFRCELQLAQQSCNTAVSRATAAAQR